MAKKDTAKQDTAGGVTIEQETQEVVTGLVVRLSPDAATHLSYFMRNAHDGRYPRVHGQKFIDNWPWAKRFVEDLDRLRSVGCTMGARVHKEDK